MSGTTPSTDGPSIGLAEMIESLRHELQTSLESGRNQAIAFDVDTVELELKVAISRKASGKGEVSFWVVKAGANVEAGRDLIHTFKLTLVPFDTELGERLKVRSKGRQAPSRD